MKESSTSCCAVMICLQAVCCSIAFNTLFYESIAFGVLRLVPSLSCLQTLAAGQMFARASVVSASLRADENDRHFWGTMHLIWRLAAKVKWLSNSKQEEEHRSDSLKWNRSKGAAAWGWRRRTWLSHDKMHKAPTGPLPAPVLYSWRELYKLSPHTLSMNAPS